MRLIVGGQGQGKLAALLSEQEIPVEKIADGETCTRREFEECLALNHLHWWIYREIRQEKPAASILQELLEKTGQNSQTIFLCDEIGSGVVPVDPLERKWREDTGRICCELARRADRVDRVLCGLMVCIKGGDA